MSIPPDKWSLVPLLLVLMFGCSGGPTLLDASQEQRPVWVQKTTVRQELRTCHVGHHTGALSKEEGRKKATLDALGWLVGQVAPGGTSDYVVRNVRQGGKTRNFLEIRLPGRKDAIRIQGVQLLEEYTERWRRGGATTVDTWVQMCVPDTSMKAVQFDIEGATLLAWRCEIKPETLCDERFVTPVKEALEKIGHRIEGPLVRLRTRSTPLSVGRKTGSAWVAAVILEGTYKGSVDGEEHLAQGKATLQIWSTSGEEMQQEISTGLLDAGHYSFKAAMQTAVGSAILELSNRIPYELNGTGAPQN